MISFSLTFLLGTVASFCEFILSSLLYDASDYNLLLLLLSAFKLPLTILDFDDFDFIFFADNPVGASYLKTYSSEFYS